MNWIIIFLGIIAVTDIVTVILQLRSHLEQRSIELLTKQLQQERDSYSKYKAQLEKDIIAQKEATNFWTKKYYELETDLKFTSKGT